MYFWPYLSTGFGTISNAAIMVIIFIIVTGVKLMFLRLFKVQVLGGFHARICLKVSRPMVAPGRRT